MTKLKPGLACATKRKQPFDKKLLFWKETSFRIS
jgi:hypothetical protein